MTTEEAFALVNRREKVAIARSSATWIGRPIGVITKPAVIVEHEDGSRVAVVLDGAEVVPLEGSQHG